MTKQFICDVCAEPFEIDQAHIEITIQEDFPGVVPSGSWDVCSWTCMYDLTLGATAGEELPQEEIEDDVPESLLTEIRETPGGGKQINITEEPVAKYAKEVEDAGVGVYFPEGMRVDGRPAEQVRKRVPKIRMVREDD